MTNPVQRVQDLHVYQLALDTQQEIFELSKQFPREEQYSLTDQIRRSSRSVGANIREAWAKRRYPAHFASKLTDAMAESSETCHWITTAKLCSYIDPSIEVKIIDQCDHVGAMLNKMVKSADNWKDT